jgi:hypothetical protein
MERMRGAVVRSGGKTRFAFVYASIDPDLSRVEGLKAIRGEDK